MSESELHERVRQLEREGLALLQKLHESRAEIAALRLHLIGMEERLESCICGSKPKAVPDPGPEESAIGGTA